MPRPSLQFSDADRRIADVLLRHGIPVSAVARELGIDEKTARKHLRDEINSAALHQACDIKLAVFRRAAKGDMRAVRFWFKNFV